MVADDRTAFWNFSVAIYGRPGVREACLRLQDEAGLDVNVLLYCLWRAARGTDLAADDLRARLAALAPWMAAAVKPLRTLRRALKAADGLPSEAGELARQLSALELEAERTAQGLILSAWPEPPAGAMGQGHALTHLSLYVSLAQARPSPDDLDLLAASL
jgi:uncharacterized protein (TIGR02444 family)